MFKRKYEDTMQYVYKRNQETNAIKVEIRLDDYDAMFRGWDASPAVHREMDPDLIRFIEESGYEISMEESIEFCFYVEKDNHDLEKEEVSGEAVKNNFRMAIFRADRTLKRNLRRMLSYIVFSIMFLVVSILFESEQADIILQLFVQGLFVGGWVLLWEAFSIFFFVSHDIRQRRKRYVKFLESDIYFKYEEDVMPTI